MCSLFTIGPAREGHASGAETKPHRIKKVHTQGTRIRIEPKHAVSRAEACFLQLGLLFVKQRAFMIKNSLELPEITFGWKILMLPPDTSIYQ